VGTREWLLTIGVIVVPLAIAIVVTLWSLEQARYRPKRKRPPSIRRDEVPAEDPAEAGGPGVGTLTDPSEPAT
jgi:hypothetical protein